MQCECQQITKSQPDFCLALTQYRLIEIAGADAEKYLQGQLTADVTKLNIGEHTLTCHCDPKGKMSALFRLYRAAAEQFFIVIRAELLPEALTQLKKYAVFSKVTFTELDTPLFGVASGEQLAKLSENSTALILPSAQKRAIVWGETLTPNGQSTLWDLADIQDGLPILAQANQFELIPQAANLQVVENAISFTKGCYIGQETVARAKYRGANKRAMFIFVGQAEAATVLPEIGGSIEMQLGDNWRATGTILAAVLHNQQLWLQVVMNKEVEDGAQFRLGNTPLKRCELPYSLEEA